MMNSKKKMLLAFGVASVMTISAASAVMAAPAERTAENGTAYSFNTGKANIKGNGGERTFVYDESEKAERGQKGNVSDKLAVLVENGTIMQETADAIDAYIAENPETRLDAETLVEAGIINQATADAICEYASQKHSDIHSRFADENADGIKNAEYSFNKGKMRRSVTDETTDTEE